MVMVKQQLFSAKGVVNIVMVALISKINYRI